MPAGRRAGDTTGRSRGATVPVSAIRRGSVTSCAVAGLGHRGDRAVRITAGHRPCHSDVTPGAVHCCRRASPTAAIGGGGGRSGAQAPAGTTTAANEKDREGQGTRWAKGSAGHAPPRSRPGSLRMRPRAASRPPGPRAPSPRRKRDRGRNQSGGPGWRPATRSPSRGRRRPSSGRRLRSSGRLAPSSGRLAPSTGRRIPGSGPAPADPRAMGVRRTATRGPGVPGTATRATGSLRRRVVDRSTDLRGTGGQGTHSDRTLGTRPETDGGQATAADGGLIQDQPILIRRWRGPRKPRRPRGSSARKAFARGVPITQRIRRLPARRRPQTQGLLGILTQNGPRKG